MFISETLPFLRSFHSESPEKLENGINILLMNLNIYFPQGMRLAFMDGIGSARRNLLSQEDLGFATSC